MTVLLRAMLGISLYLHLCAVVALGVLVVNGAMP